MRRCGLVSLAITLCGLATGIALAQPITAASTNACPTLLRTDPDVLRVVNGYAQGSARNPRMTANQTIDFIAANITREVASTSPTLVNRNPSLFYRSFEHITGGTIANCWPTLNAVIVDKERKEAIETERQVAASRAEQQRQKDAEAALAERLQKQAAIEAQPATKLLRAYRSYIGVRQCFDARKGYAAVYINDEQVADAKTRVLAIERTMKAADPTIDPDAVWKKANGPETDAAPTNEIAAVLMMADAMGKRWVSSPDWVDESDEYCKRSYLSLKEQHFSIAPDTRILRKDF